MCVCFYCDVCSAGGIYTPHIIIICVFTPLILPFFTICVSTFRLVIHFGIDFLSATFVIRICRNERSSSAHDPTKNEQKKM